MSENKGTIVQVMGPVVDVAFPSGALPALQEALDPGEARINAADTAEQVFRLIQLKLSC